MRYGDRRERPARRAVSCDDRVPSATCPVGLTRVSERRDNEFTYTLYDSVHDSCDQAVFLSRCIGRCTRAFSTH